MAQAKKKEAARQGSKQQQQQQNPEVAKDKEEMALAARLVDVYARLEEIDAAGGCQTEGGIAFSEGCDCQDHLIYVCSWIWVCVQGQWGEGRGMQKHSIQRHDSAALACANALLPADMETALLGGLALFSTHLLVYSINACWFTYTLTLPALV